MLVLTTLAKLSLRVHLRILYDIDGKLGDHLRVSIRYSSMAIELTCNQHVDHRIDQWWDCGHDLAVPGCVDWLSGCQHLDG